MGYFDTKNESQLIVEASPVGLSAILIQKCPGENSIQSTEKEALAMVWGIEHFHTHLYGVPFTL